MVSECANPGCRAPFIYFRGGRLFAIPRRDSSSTVQCFWLCGNCAEDLDLSFDGEDLEPVLVPRHLPRNAPPARVA